MKCTKVLNLAAVRLSLASSSDVISRDAQDDLMTQHFSSIKGKKSFAFWCVYWVLCTLIDKRSNTFQLLSKS